MGELTLRLALPAGVFVLTWHGLSIIAALLHYFAGERLKAVEPGHRSVILLAIALAPVVISGLVCLLVFAPSLGGFIIDSHCHGGVCAPHFPVLSASTLVAGSTVFIIVAATVIAGAVLLQALLRTILTGRILLGVAEPASRDYRILETRQPLAYCIGLLRPRIVISRGLLSGLDETGLGIVLAHERAHADRLDNLRNLLGWLSTMPMPRRWRRAIVAELRLASEQACDQHAARQTGDPLRVADTLLSIRRGSTMTPAAAGIAISALCEHELERRVLALVEPPWRAPAGGWLLAGCIVAVYLSLTLAGTEFVHHAIEAFFAY